MKTPEDRRARKKAQRRRALLDVALKLIAERGIHGTRVEDITERSDLGKGAFYNYFPSKAALVAALVATGVELLCTEHLSDLDVAPDRIAAVIRGHEAFFTKHPVFAVLFHQARGIARPDAPGNELQRVFADYLRRVGDLLVSPEARAPTTDEARMDFAAVIVGSIAGYRSFRIAAGLEMHPDALTRALTVGVPAILASR